MIIPMLCVTIFVILVVWFLLPRVARLRSEERRVGKECRAWWSRSFFKQKTAYEIGLGIPAEPLFRSFAIQRLMNAMRQAHADGWFIVFDTLTLADDRLEAFYDNPNALRDYFRDIGRMVLAAEGRKANDSHADCYQYFCVPEY